jgi:lysozyme family protein
VKTVSSIIDEILSVEGGHSNDPDDPGGETMHGITEAVARQAGYFGPMRDLPLEYARDIYKGRYVTIPRFDQVVAIDPDIGTELVDTGVNMGPHRAAEFLQRWLNAFNYDHRYPALFVDGRIGPVTLQALKAFIAWREGEGGRQVLLTALNAVQGARYLEIAEARPTQRKFVYGWVSKRVAS